MKRIQMPSSYAVVTEEEKELLGGGGAFRDAWDSFTDHLRLNDFFFRGGLLSLSISFIPMLLFNVVKPDSMWQKTSTPSCSAAPARQRRTSRTTEMICTLCTRT